MWTFEKPKSVKADKTILDMILAASDGAIVVVTGYDPMTKTVTIDAAPEPAPDLIVEK